MWVTRGLSVLALIGVLVASGVAAPETARATHPSAALLSLQAGKVSGGVQYLNASWSWSGVQGDVTDLSLQRSTVSNFTSGVGTIAVCSAPCSVTSYYWSNWSTAAVTQYVRVRIIASTGGSSHITYSNVEAVTACDANGANCGSWSAPPPPPPEPPDPPAAPEITDVQTSSDSATLTWSTPATTETYKVWRKRTSATEWSLPVEMTDPNNTHTFEDLTPSRSYDFKVAACNEGGCTESDVESAATGADPSSGGWSQSDSENLETMMLRQNQSHLVLVFGFGFALFALSGVLVFAFKGAL